MRRKYLKPNIQWRIVIFEPMRSYRYIIPRKPLSGAINMRGRKMTIFGQYLAISWKWYKIAGPVTIH